MTVMKILKNWLDAERGRGASLSRHLRVKSSFVSNMAAGVKTIPVHLGAAIEGFTRGEVSRKAMFPNDWQRIWPELADADCASVEQQAQAQEVGAA